MLYKANQSLIPVSNPRANYLTHKKQIDNAITRVLAHGTYILGLEGERFEEEFAALLGVSHCVGVASGTDAVSHALQAVGVSSGDEVVTVSHSAVATVAAIEQIGAVPVFCDIEEETLCLDPDKIEAAITQKTKALLPVHIYGQPADMLRIIEVARAHGIAVVEDCAQAAGARIGKEYCGTFGDAAAFSFYPTKNLGALGDGGAVVTNSEKVCEQVRMLRQYGWRQRYVSEVQGRNSRLDEIQAAVLRVKLPFLEEENERRRAIGAKYSSMCEEGILFASQRRGDTMHSMHLFVVRVKAREEFEEFLQQQGIGTARHYPLAIHQQPAYAQRIRRSGALPITEKIYGEIVSLPMYPELTELEIERITSSIEKWIVGHGASF